MQRSEWSDDEACAGMPAAYAASPWPAILQHLVHSLTRDAVSRSAFASQVHLSLSTVSRVLSGQPRVKRVEYGRMRVWLWRRDEEYVRVREGEGRGGSGVTEAEWEEWKALAMELEQRQRIDNLLIAADEGAAAGETAGNAVEAEVAAEAASETVEEAADAADVSMDTDDDGTKEDASSMEVDSNGADSVIAATDAVTNVRSTRNGGRRNSRSRRQSPALKPATTDDQPDVATSDLSSSLQASAPSPNTLAASSPTASTAFSTAASTSAASPSTSSAVVSSAASPTSSTSSLASLTSSFLLSALPSVPPPYFTSADAIVDRLDFYILQLHLSQKTVALLTSLPLTTVSQLIRHVYKPWPTPEQQPLAASAAAGSPTAVFVVVVALLWWLDGMLSGVVRARVGNVHDTCNLAFLSSLTVSGLSRERLNVWLDGKTANPLHDRQWIDEIAVKEFGVTQEAVVREWEKARIAAAETMADSSTQGGDGVSGGG